MNCTFETQVHLFPLSANLFSLCFSSLPSPYRLPVICGLHCFQGNKSLFTDCFTWFDHDSGSFQVLVDKTSQGGLPNWVLTRHFLSSSLTVQKAALFHNNTCASPWVSFSSQSLELLMPLWQQTKYPNYQVTQVLFVESLSQHQSCCVTW